MLEHLISEAFALAAGVTQLPPENATQAVSHLTTLFEQIGNSSDTAHYHYPSTALSAASIFPQRANSTPASYATLWQDFVEAVTKIPNSHQHSLPLWLDHFDSCWQVYAQAIPSRFSSDTSLYDHSRLAAAFAVALWHNRQADKGQNEQARDKASEFLLIQGDFFGIQPFIFAQGAETTKHAARLLRGRSQYVSLITECAALKLLESLNLPSSSQIINAAGKFLILAANTEQSRHSIARVQAIFNDWFLQHCYGESGLGLATVTAGKRQFIKETGQFPGLLQQLFEALAISKVQRLNLCTNEAPNAVLPDYVQQIQSHGGVVCPITGKGAASSAITTASSASEGLNVSPLAHDQIEIGRRIGGKAERLAITRSKLRGTQLEVSLFGYHMRFISDEESSGQFSHEAQHGNLRRLFDFSLASDTHQVSWNGYARRAINGYVATLSAADLTSPRYDDLAPPEQPGQEGDIKEFSHIARDDRQLTSNATKPYRGTVGLGVLKGDVDNLGWLFQHGLQHPSLATMTALSRQVNAFFSLYLPALCAEKYPNTYTVFAGGDDFFLIGPWHSLILLAAELRQSFREYTANNEKITFSAGIAMCKPTTPIPQLARLGESALMEAKAYHHGDRIKNALRLLSQTIHWDDYHQVDQAAQVLIELADSAQLSTGYFYQLLELIDLAEQQDRPESGLWRSRLSYRTIRHLSTLNSSQQDRDALYQKLVQTIGADGIAKLKSAYRIPVSMYLYRHRD
ncbi:type III-A CRISPR-associated protein Cas10/Csm1 [Bacterioplanes sanyensis]|nr:type III-A CRISPR-associated protein Cas10/Csm1 [Bacterioplanes sanyensis]